MEEQAVVEYWKQVKRMIDATCADYDKLWQRRSRVLNSKIILMMIFKLASNNRRQGLFINLTEFWNVCDEKGIKLPQARSVAASTFCEARQKISEDIFKDLNRSLLKNWEEKRNLNRWLGLRVFAVDGSRVNIPRELTSSGFKIYDEDRRHYPQGLLSCLYDILGKTVYDFDFVSHMNERHCALKHLEILEPKDVVIFDRGYFSYLLLHEFYKKGVYVLFRLQDGPSNKEIEAFMKSSKKDDKITYVPSFTVISDLKNKDII